MRRALLALAAAFMLSACAVLDGAYEDEQRRECERDNRGVERAMC